MGLTGDKWIVMTMLAVLSIVLGFLPYLLTRMSKKKQFIHTNSMAYKLILTVLACFGAGVLLSLAFMHLMPHVREGLGTDSPVWQTFDEHFPVAELLILAGFAMIYLVEELAHFIMVEGHHFHHHHHAPDSIARHSSIAHGIQLPEDTCGGGHGQSNGSECSSNEEDGGHEPTLTIPHHHHHHHHHFSTAGGGELGEEEHCPDEQNTVASSIRALLTLIALSFHEIMEGIAIGIQSEKGLWVMFGGVASHKLVISFCMGMELMSRGASVRTYVGSILFFGITTSVGIVIGGLISTDNVESVGVVVIEGIVVGTLIYVVCFEILNRERERKTYSMKSTRAIGFLQFLALGIGMVAMGWLAIVAHDDHGDDGHEGHDH